MKKIAAVAAGFLVVFTFAIPGFAQERSAAELDQMLGPIALYPDPLIAEILSASTFPSQIVEADRYVSEGGDPNQADQQPWDPSVQALVHYPAVLKWLDDNLAWTTQLGQAFTTQQSDVMDSVQRLRAQAENLGNLPSTPQETVTSDDGDIEIEPTDPDEMYVPTYQPDVIFDQAGVYCTFGIGLPIGLWLGYDWDWHGRRMIQWGPGHPRPGNWFHESPGARRSYISGNRVAAWHGGGGGAVVRGGRDRGYAPETVSRPAPVVPRTPRENIESAREATRPAFRAPSAELPRNFARPEPAPAFHSREPSGGVFGGFQSGSEARESSSRGMESRATMSPSRGGGGSNKR
ncbi:MAG TPA: DUF3300 domain-containing protein [Verrucomicrobiae bacterium]|jgi:hypothetical protein|nr:DUF3300 domain-containing protein [Verrucomicrobiae bacterium]